MSKKLIVFAQKAEAEASLRALNATPVAGETGLIWTEGEVPCCYEFEHGWIVLSNIGIHSAQMTVTKYASQADEIWNFGIAGALRENLPVGQIFVIETVGKYIPSGELDSTSQKCVYATVPHLKLQEGNSKLISSDFPIHDHYHRNHLAKEWDLVDMEGYGIAYAAYHLGKKCRIWKIISDFALPGARELIRKNKAKLSETIAETLYETIYESSPHP